MTIADIKRDVMKDGTGKYGLGVPNIITKKKNNFFFPHRRGGGEVGGSVLRCDMSEMDHTEVGPTQLNRG